MPIGYRGVGIQGEVANGSPSENSVFDPDVNFVTNGTKVGNTIVNLNDTSQATVTAIIDATHILTSPLETGRTNLWSAGDTYRIYLDDIDLSSTLDVTFSVGAEFKFASRLIDARRQARIREYQIQRHGVWADYKNAYSSSDRDEYSGVQRITGADYEPHDRYGGPQIDYLSDNAPNVINMELLYGPTEKMKFIYMNAQEGSQQTQYGIVVQGAAVLGASLYAPYRKGDLIKIHDKIWMVSEIPQFEYSRNREIIGYRLTVSLAGGKVQGITW